MESKPDFDVPSHAWRFNGHVLDHQQPGPRCKETPGEGDAKKPLTPSSSSGTPAGQRAIRSGPQTINEEMANRLSERSLEDLIEYIITRFHHPLGVRLTNTEALIDMVMNSGGSDLVVPGRQIRSAFAALKEKLSLHLLKEEKVLFPKIRSGRGPTAAELVGSLNREHGSMAVKIRTIVALVAQLSRRTPFHAGYQALHDTLRELEAELADHFHLESNLLFPRALRGER
jgi:iron-sulfur cluster repair protein YtfE (RIC family)